MDSDNNIFLFRQKTDSILKGAMNVDQLMTHLGYLRNETEKHINSSHTKIDRNLFYKIQKWDTLKRNDVEHLFNNEPLVITDPDEIALIRRYRMKRKIGNKK